MSRKVNHMNQLGKLVQRLKDKNVLDPVKRIGLKTGGTAGQQRVEEWSERKSLGK